MTILGVHTPAYIHRATCVSMEYVTCRVLWSYNSRNVRCRHTHTRTQAHAHIRIDADIRTYGQCHPQDMDGADHRKSWETFTTVDAGSGKAGSLK